MAFQSRFYRYIIYSNFTVDHTINAADFSVFPLEGAYNIILSFPPVGESRGNNIIFTVARAPSHTAPKVFSCCGGTVKSPRLCVIYATHRRRSEKPFFLQAARPPINIYNIHVRTCTIRPFYATDIVLYINTYHNMI